MNIVMLVEDVLRINYLIVNHMTVLGHISTLLLATLSMTTVLLNNLRLIRRTIRAATIYILRFLDKLGLMTEMNNGANI